MTNEPTVGELARKLDRLERQNRHLRLAVGAGLLVAVAGATTAQIASKALLSAEQITLVDAEHHLKASLETLTTTKFAGNPALTFYDADGHARIRLGLTAAGPALEVIDGQGKLRDFFGGTKVHPVSQP